MFRSTLPEAERLSVDELIRDLCLTGKRARHVGGADNIIETFRPYRERRAELAEDPGLVDRVLAEGAARARPVARSTLDAVRKAMHLS